MNLHIDLQEGFHRDKVKIIINNKQHYLNPDLNTRLQTNLADKFETQIEDLPVKIEIKVETKKIKKIITLDNNEETYVGFSITRDGKLKYKIQDTPFFYM
jgi:hypothetical protein